MSCDKNKGNYIKTFVPATIKKGLTKSVTMSFITYSKDTVRNNTFPHVALPL